MRIFFYALHKYSQIKSYKLSRTFLFRLVNVAWNFLYHRLDLQTQNNSILREQTVGSKWWTSDAKLSDKDDWRAATFSRTNSRILLFSLDILLALYMISLRTVEIQGALLGSKQWTVKAVDIFLVYFYILCLKMGSLNIMQSMQKYICWQNTDGIM